MSTPELLLVISNPDVADVETGAQAASPNLALIQGTRQALQGEWLDPKKYEYFQWKGVDWKTHVDEATGEPFKSIYSP